MNDPAPPLPPGEREIYGCSSYLDEEIIEIFEEIVRKVILRHANLSTTQRYLGKVSDVEALRWIENVYA